ncbi:hypothetical protein ACLMK3_10750 [Streptococcus anginosus]|uniref:hypothetical protein n=1 Tax=Streptococcus anginosus TaxID=1328 RepID=UPI00398C92CA
MTFDDLIRFKALNLKYISSGSNILDLMDKGSITAEIPMKNVCAMITQQLFDDLTNICGLLDISKRQFIESAIIEALKKAQSIMDAEGLEDYLVQRTQEREQSREEG